jgi:putative DNA methylase
LRLIETDAFPFEFLSRLGERESWRKEIHRPIYHVHKWWAKRLGSVFRGILLGCQLPEDGDLAEEFYRSQSSSGTTVFDPFMGSGTTVGEAHKLGFTALGRDINPVAVNAVRVAFGPMERGKVERAFKDLSRGVGDEIRALYRSKDSRGRPCDVLYYFWVMQADCPGCRTPVDLFSSRVIARNAYPARKPEVQVVCPDCGEIFPGLHGQESASCPSCRTTFDPERGSAKGAKATCPECARTFTILDALGGRRPAFRLYGKLALTEGGAKEYSRATPEDRDAYEACRRRLHEEVAAGLPLPDLALEDGYNTRQAMGYGFVSWRDFFNDRQLLALGTLRRAIAAIADGPTRDALLTLFSGVLEFNNMSASYKGEGTGAVRHMFSHHILKPERMPIEANVWGTPKSSGSFSNLFRGRLLRAIEYRSAPTEINGRAGTAGRVCSHPFSGEVLDWPTVDPPPPGPSPSRAATPPTPASPTGASTSSRPTPRSSTTSTIPSWPISSTPGSSSIGKMVTGPPDAPPRSRTPRRAASPTS